MKITKFLLINILLGTAIVSAACGPKVEPTPTVDPNAIMTQVAMTIQADVTQKALLTPSPTATLRPTATLMPGPTQALTAAPSSQPALAPTLPSASPDNAILISETIPDDTINWKGQTFTKIWKLENTGTTTWDSTYKLVYVDSEPKGQILGETIIPITYPVKPDNQIEISVPMKAPETLVTVTNWYRMMNAKGQFFGDNLWVKIIVGY